MSNKPTHIRKKTGNKVYVERYEGGIIVVKSMRGKVIGSYERDQMSLFYKRYESIKVGKRNRS